MFYEVPGQVYFLPVSVTNRCIHLRLAKQQISGLCDAFRVCELLAKNVFMCRECFHPESVRAVGSDWK
jgi:hypothetical protein